MVVIKKWVFATFILTFLVIIAGGIVRTTQSGMGCPDWPKCFGMWVPPTNASQLPADFEKYLKAQDIDHSFNVYHTWIEYINRLLGVLLGLFAVIQAALLFFRKKQQIQAYKLSIAFLAGVILTGLFGAIVVKFNLAHATISIHLFFAIVLAQIQLALYMSVKGKLYKKTAGTKMRRAIFVLLIIIFAQSVLGTMVRMYIDDISSALHFEQREAWLAEMPVAFLIHRTFSWFVLAAVFYTNWYCRKVPVLKNPLRKLIGVILMSVITGVILYYLDMPALAQPLHLLLAAIAITQTMYILLYTKNTTDLLKPQVL
ncbi:MAG: COX15/CtaA family protein [Ferruginibacter sp.]|nr:COX15/CtaA family protein [Ferruginibacter sp.]